MFSANGSYRENMTRSPKIYRNKHFFFFLHFFLFHKLNFDCGLCSRFPSEAFLSRILPLSNGAKVQMINIRNIEHSVQSLVGDKEKPLHSSAILCGVAKKGRETKQISTRKQYRYSYPTRLLLALKT